MSALLPVAEALKVLAAHRPAPKSRSILLADALGHRLAAPVIAQCTQPPASVSAMDGYAVRLEDVATAGAQLRVIGEAPAGRPFDGEIGTGEAVRIFTGGELPAGASHIVIQEDVSREGDTITCNGAWQTARHIRVAGLDFKTGDTLLAPGTVLGPAEILVAAAANHAEIEVAKPVNVALLANGNELKPPGSVLERGNIVSSNPHGLGALIESWGGQVINLGIASDSVDSILALIENAADADIILPIGGASVGDHDHMRAAFNAAGFEMVFSKIAVKPGKPTWFAKKGKTCVLGLPGNPASAFVCAHLFLSVLMGTPSEPLSRAVLATPLKANGPRAEYLRATAEISGKGEVVVTPLPKQDSSLMVPFLQANCLIVRPPNTPALDAGERCEIKLIGDGLGR